MSEITAEQILQMKSIVDRYENFKCIECASNIKDYLTSQGIPGKRIKLYTEDTEEVGTVAFMMIAYRERLFQSMVVTKESL